MTRMMIPAPRSLPGPGCGGLRLRGPRARRLPAGAAGAPPQGLVDPPTAGTAAAAILTVTARVTVTVLRPPDSAQVWDSEWQIRLNLVTWHEEPPMLGRKARRASLDCRGSPSGWRRGACAAIGSDNLSESVTVMLELLLAASHGPRSARRIVTLTSVTQARTALLPAITRESPGGRPSRFQLRGSLDSSFCTCGAIIDF